MDPQALFEAYKRVITEHYVDFEGRVARTPFWHYILVYAVIYVGLAIIDSILSTRALTGLYSLGLLLPTLGMTVRRLHDTNRSGWWAALGAVPVCLSFLALLSMFGLGLFGFLFFFVGILPLASLACAVVLIYFCAQPGVVGSNQYGAEPAGGTTAAPVS